MLSPVPTDAAEKTAAVALLASAIGAPVATASACWASRRRWWKITR